VLCYRNLSSLPHVDAENFTSLTVNDLKNALKQYWCSTKAFCTRKNIM